MRFKGRLWHGVGTTEAWRHLEDGGHLEIPPRYAHDPGDYGRAVYFTDSKIRAVQYAARLERRVLLVQATVELKNPLVIDWREGSPLDPEHPANIILDELADRFGNPVRGVPEAREAAARRWREELMKAGHDGVVSMRRGETEVAVYDPKKSVTDIELHPTLEAGDS